MRLSNAKQRLAVVGLLWLWCAALIAYRLHLAYDWLAMGLLWNLFLATVPLLWSTVFGIAIERKRPFLAAIYFFLWLLFFPNAPYLLTDLIHLEAAPHAPLWFVLAMLLSCAGTGTLFGYLSLTRIHSVVERRWNKATGWAVVVSSLLLCGFGIYLGRFLRWNSWDAFTHPIRLLKSITGQAISTLPHPHPLSVTLIFGVGLFIGYLGVRVIGANAD